MKPPTPPPPKGWAEAARGRNKHTRQKTAGTSDLTSTFPGELTEAFTIEKRETFSISWLLNRIFIKIPAHKHISGNTIIQAFKSVKSVSRPDCRI
jgi:hypothetical protein